MAVDRDKDTEQVNKRRTHQQNKALHKFFELLADELNNAGFDMKRTLRADIDIPWQPDTVKEYLWRPVQKAQLLKESTTELDTKEIDMIVDTLTRHLGQKTGVTVEFPSIEAVIREQKARER